MPTQTGAPRDMYTVLKSTVVASDMFTIFAVFILNRDSVTISEGVSGCIKRKRGSKGTDVHVDL